VCSSFSPNLSRIGLAGINTSLRLNTWDQVRLVNRQGTLEDNCNLWTHFTGWPLSYANGLPNYLAMNGISASLRLKVGDSQIVQN